MKNKCTNCNNQVGEVGTFCCSTCGVKVTPTWERFGNPQEFLEDITGEKYIKSSYWNDDYCGFTDKWGNSYYCGYENGWKLEINDVKIVGITKTLKWYEQFASKEAIDYHLNAYDFYKTIFAGLAVVIQLNKK